MFNSLCVWKTLRSWLTSGRPWLRCRTQTRLSVEPLEDRTVPATVWLDTASTVNAYEGLSVGCFSVRLDQTEGSLTVTFEVAPSSTAMRRTS